MEPSLLVPAQVRAARGLLSWSQDKLADSAGIALSSVRDFENQKRTVEGQVAAAILRALVDAGVTFIPGDEEAGPGVRLNADRPMSRPVPPWPAGSCNWAWQPERPVALHFSVPG